MKFTDTKIEELFGAEDAEGEPRERFKEYFVQNRAYELLTEDLPIRIFGRPQRRREKRTSQTRVPR